MDKKTIIPSNNESVKSPSPRNTSVRNVDSEKVNVNVW